MHVLRNTRRLRQRTQDGHIQARNLSDVVEVVELQQVAILLTVLGANVLMLMVEVLAPFCEANGWEALLAERAMIAATQEAIQS